MQADVAAFGVGLERRLFGCRDRVWVQPTVELLWALEGLASVARLDRFEFVEHFMERLPSDTFSFREALGVLLDVAFEIKHRRTEGRAGADGAFATDGDSAESG